MWEKLILILFAFVYFSSCKNDAKFLNPTKNDNTIEYVAEIIPKYYLEVQTDTILSNDFRVQIKYKSLNKNVLKITEKTPFKISKTYYREFESNLQVFNGTQVVLDKKISKEDFEEDLDKQFWGKAILQFVELDQIKSQKTEKIVVKFHFFNPQISKNKLYNLFVDRKGNLEIELVS